MPIINRRSGRTKGWILLITIKNDVVIMGSITSVNKMLIENNLGNNRFGKV
jgi:hypothetical protein